MKKRIKKIMILLCGFMLLITFFWNNVVLAANYKGAEGESSWDAFLNYFAATIREDKSKVTDDEIWRFSKGPTKDEEKEGVNMYTGDSALSDVRDAVDDLADKRKIDLKSDIAPSKTKKSSTAGTDTKTQTQTQTKTTSNDYFDKNKGKYVYKGFENESKWDAFYEYFVYYWNNDQTKLTNAELSRYKAGPTKEEENLAKEGRGPTIRPTDVGQTAVTIDQVTELIETRNASGNDSAALDNGGYDKVRKEAQALYNEYTDYNINTEKTKRKTAGKKFLSKCEELKKLNNGRFLKDGELLGWIREVSGELGVSTDKFYSGQEGESEGKTTIYVQPEVTTNKTAGSTLDDMMSDADKFIEKGKTKGLDNLPSVSNTIYNILLIVGIIIAVLVGAILGIKLMVSGIEEKAEVKKLLVSYVVGCIIIFGGFGIWKIVVSVLQTV